MNKWKMNRAGLLNFWYYDEEIFTFADGKLLLRGSNGSGKSVTMQSFLPVLLDGRTSPDRLDPFGSKARRMEDYLLGEKDIVNRDERTGYLFLEFKRQGTEQFTTIGIGLQAKRNKQMKFWGFVVTDNRRIGTDFELYKYEKSGGEKQKIPLSRIELENMLGDGGHVVQTKSDYMKLVNKYLFGFGTIEAYEDLIKLLIQLRSPKLSKDFRPTVIYEILEAALPPLSDEDLRHLSDTIEQMDQTKQQIEQLEREATAIKNLNKSYDSYNQRILVDHANEYMQSSKRLAKEQKEYEELTETVTHLDEEIQQLSDEIRELSIEKDTQKKQEELLRSHKVWNLEKERREVEEKRTQEADSLQKKNGQLQDKKIKETNVIRDKNLIDEKIGAREEAMKDMSIDLENDAEEVSFQETHKINYQDFVRHQKELFDFSVWQKEATDHLAGLETIEAELRNFEALKTRFQEKDKQLGNEQKLLDDVTYQEQEWSRLFEEDKQKKLNEIHTWVGGLSWLNKQEDRLQETARAIFSLYEQTTFESVKEPFRQATFQYEQEQRKALSELEFQREQLEKKIRETEDELQKWKEKKDPEPELASLTKEARKQLDRKGIASVPIYAAVEFQDHVEQDVRKRIEAAMMDSGLLDALITDRDITIEHDRILKPNPNMMAFTLADYLKPDLEVDNKVPASLVDDVLRSIIVGEEDDSILSISEQGHYQLGLLKGHALPVDDVRYIGRNARKRFREEQIERIQQELEILHEEKQLKEREITRIETAINQAKKQFEQFPNDSDLQESFHQIKEARMAIDYHQKQVQRLSNELKEIHKAYTQVKHRIDERTRNYNLEVSLESYKEAISVTKRYEKDLSNLEKEHIQYINERNRLNDLAGRLDELAEEIIEIQGEINLSQDLVDRLEHQLTMIEQQLEQQGVGDIRKQISDVQIALEEIGRMLKEKETTKPTKVAERNHLNQNIELKRKEINFWTNMHNVWKASFEQEVLRGFVVQGEDKELDVIVKKVLRDYASLLKEKDRGKLSTQLMQEFYKQQSDLMEYRANTFNAPLTIPAWMNETTEADHIPHIEQWKQKMTRQLIELNYQGKQVNPYTVQQQIEFEQARQESFLDDQDQALYEEILFNSVGQKLRARIRRAEQWVEKMKKLMETRDTSSGLSFSIKWKPRTADSETEMDTVDLVHLLRQDPKLLKEEDLEKITIHFRTKIAKAKELMGNSNELQTLLQVLKEVLDYRKWFSFVLYFQREGEKKRELNNNQFYKFSGGEKAMAMYIPLFTACYSRYLEADSEAPYIISLDEAFAGVDENNIREMFEIVEQLGFNYIMNSQVLWGDYDTILELSICELVRPKNADFVSVLRYHWDGNKMEVEVPTEALVEVR
ncbi:TIGR02680 family protein [Ornithinibacillus halophilus]|uniref:TIGR02680 family protein n=1 Tax=Ornithinibacillus halophilus TaxID=930117 RepID=A0A1M5KEU5_9BACI|nr:TIGR02680 family protein [Ornithinibacillus halophilus]SHG51376.1 TIGR02680 family protein [Ornithinibacillus halophilus]